jgi:hypothetical protein
VYINTGSTNPNEQPKFTSAAEGITIVQPATTQMMSGADAVDFNRDGDIDILTGQGHGQSGLRFFERSFINNTLNNTHPVITAGKLQSMKKR